VTKYFKSGMPPKEDTKRGSAKVDNTTSAQGFLSQKVPSPKIATTNVRIPKI